MAAAKRPGELVATLKSLAQYGFCCPDRTTPLPNSNSILVAEGPMGFDRYVQDCGKLWQVADDGTASLLGTGWAGNDSRAGVNPTHIPGRNNPEAQTIRCIGPLPVGWYTMSEPFHHPELGPLTFVLTPDPGNEMFGRDTFRMHGAGGDDPENASEGCIIQAHDVRQAVADSGVRRMQVVAHEDAA